MKTLMAVLIGGGLGLAACDPAPGSEIDCTPAAAPDGVSTEVPPSTAAALQSWLANDGYAGFLGESADHGSTGPHGRVRTFVNAQLAGSLADCAASHPVGAAAVKELYDAGAVAGWAVMIKTRPDAGADSWYWYEVFATEPDAAAAVSSQGSGSCTGCHDAGLDAVRSGWPLR
ncbi:MAG: hypothetical protein H6709_07905 [Kofleriaceae bacterium]|nr:hypothetical protein [Myxococcales bacterium]MCB9572002.1 hypothetical protein [Kofleriaceae bacterium]